MSKFYYLADVKDGKVTNLRRTFPSREPSSNQIGLSFEEYSLLEHLGNDYLSEALRIVRSIQKKVNTVSGESLEDLFIKYGV